MLIIILFEGHRESKWVRGLSSQFWLMSQIPVMAEAKACEASSPSIKVTTCCHQGVLSAGTWDWKVNQASRSWPMGWDADFPNSILTTTLNDRPNTIFSLRVSTRWHTLIDAVLCQSPIHEGSMLMTQSPPRYPQLPPGAKIHTAANNEIKLRDHTVWSAVGTRWVVAKTNS